MVNAETARQIALALPGTEEKDHFGMPSFRAGGRIFSTLRLNQPLMMVQLPLIEQSVFNAFNPSVFYPVPNKWGQKGATFVALDKVRQDMLEDALRVAWEHAHKKPSKK